jgi:hypothetical protein
MSDHADRERDSRRRQRFRDLVISEAIVQQPGTRRMIRNASGSGTMIAIDLAQDIASPSVKSPTMIVSAEFPTLPKTMMGNEPIKVDDNVLLQRFRMGQNLSAYINEPEQQKGLLGGLKSIVENSEPQQDAKKTANSYQPQKSQEKLVDEYMMQTLPLLNNWQIRNELVYDIKNGWQNKYAKPSAERKTKSQLAEELKMCHDTVPQMYFDPGFQVFEPKFFQDKAEQKNTIIMQEKLSSYMDLVEITILDHISELSQSFFEAMYTTDVRFSGSPLN